jgi:AraC-like DNA-binding protein
MVSARQLERDTQTWLGVSPGSYAKLVRFQRVAQDIAHGKALSYCAAKHHFSDQSHLNRLFQECAHMTPRQFAKLASLPLRVIERNATAGRVMVVDAPDEML